MPDNERIRYDTTTGQPYRMDAQGQRVYLDRSEVKPCAAEAVSQTASTSEEEPSASDVDAETAKAYEFVPQQQAVPCAEGVAAPLLANVRYGGFFVRLAAFIIDAIIAGAAAGLLSLPFALFQLNNLLFGYSLADIMRYVIFTAYFVIFTASGGATLGKRLFNLKVVSQDGSRVGWWNAIYRESIGKYLNSLLCIGYILTAADSQKRGIHDRLCDTRVIYTI